MSYLPQKLICPNCGNEELQVSNEVDVKSKGKDYSGSKGCLGFLLFGPLGLLCGSCGQGKQIESTNTTYFVCPKCGEKFRRPADLKKEIDTLKKSGNIAWIAMAIMFFIVGVIMSNLADEGFGFSLFIHVFCQLLAFGIWGITRLMASSKQKELDDIVERMNRYIEK